MRWGPAASMMAALALLLALAPAVTSEMAPDIASAANADEPYRLGRVRHDHLRTVKPHLNGEDATARTALAEQCVQLDRRCLRYLRLHRETARRAVPDNPAYWESYRAMLEATPMAQPGENVGDFDYSAYFDLARRWPMHELLAAGRLDPNRVHFHVMAHRRLLAESNLLINWMVFLGSASVTASEINVLMAQLANPPTDTQRRLLDEMLSRLTLGERSMRRAFDGEYRHIVSRQEELRDHPEWNLASLEQVRTMFDYLSDRSELPWGNYWREGVDVLADVPGYVDPAAVPAYEQYLNNMRYVDAALRLLRALREVYEGRESPGIPALPPLALWHWQWRDDAQTLCLEPGYVHVSLGQPETICMEYLGTQDGTYTLEQAP